MEISIAVTRNEVIQTKAWYRIDAELLPVNWEWWDSGKRSAWISEQNFDASEFETVDYQPDDAPIGVSRVEIVGVNQ